MSLAASHSKRRSVRAGVLSAARMPRRSIHTVMLPWPGAGVTPMAPAGTQGQQGVVVVGQGWGGKQADKLRQAYQFILLAQHS